MAAYLWIEGIAGTSKKPGHRNETEITSVAFANLQNGRASSMFGGFRANLESLDSKSLGDVIVTKEMDAISPLLAQAAAGGKHFPSAVVTVAGPSGKGVYLFKITMTDVYISHIQMGGFKPADTISFSYGDIVVDSASTA